MASKDRHMINKKNGDAVGEMVDAVRFFASQGWVPATSSNFSIRDGERVAISISGRDKNRFSESDVMWVDAQMRPTEDSLARGIKTSAEAKIHQVIYERFTHARAVFHTHSVSSTVLSRAVADLSFSNYEILKGLAGVADHGVRVEVPIYKNSQDMESFSSMVKTELPQSSWGFLIEGHGLYTWGESVAIARRHIEVFEFLFECRLKEMSLK